jgi:hypothetical protein
MHQKWTTLRHAEKTQQRIERLLEWDLRRIRVRFYTDQKSFQSGHGFQSADVNVMAFTKPSDHSVHLGPGVILENFDRIFGHELVHVMLQQKHKASVPKWLEEGLANHFGQKGVAAKQKIKLDYQWLLTQLGATDVRNLVHPFNGALGTRARFHYQASTALAEMIDRRCDLSHLLQLGLGRSLESYLPTLCEIKDLNVEFRNYLKSRSGSLSSSL